MATHLSWSSLGNATSIKAYFGGSWRTPVSLCLGPKFTATRPNEHFRLARMVRRVATWARLLERIGPALAVKARLNGHTLCTFLRTLAFRGSHASGSTQRRVGNG